MLKRRLEGITDKWAYDIGITLNKYLDFIEWKLDEDKTYNYLQKLKNYYSVSSYRKRTFQIRRFLQYLDVGWADTIKVPSEPVKMPKRITMDDIRKTFDFFNKHEYELQMKSVLLLGSTSGIRPEELYKLQEGDFDFSNNTVRIEHNPDIGKTVKTAKSRITFFNNNTKEYLKNYFDVFNDKTCYRLSYLFGQRHIEKEFYKSPIRVKDLRKFFSQEWDRRGGPTSIKKMIMGHSLRGDADRKHYNHQSEEDLKKIYNRIMDNLYFFQNI